MIKEYREEHLRLLNLREIDKKCLSDKKENLLPYFKNQDAYTLFNKKGQAIACFGTVSYDSLENEKAVWIIGSEEIKGNERVKEAARILGKTNLNYYGFVEGDNLYRGAVDVVVCDGFVGNVALKASEGVIHMLRHFLRQSFDHNIFTRIASLIVSPILSNFQKKLDPRIYNGANFIGLQGVVIKSHGGADELAFANAINIAIIESKKDMIGSISKHLESSLESQDL